MISLLPFQILWYSIFIYPNFEACFMPTTTSFLKMYCKTIFTRPSQKQSIDLIGPLNSVLKKAAKTIQNHLQKYFYMPKSVWHFSQAHIWCILTLCKLTCWMKPTLIKINNFRRVKHLKYSFSPRLFHHKEPEKKLSFLLFPVIFKIKFSIYSLCL